MKKSLLAVVGATLALSLPVVAVPAPVGGAEEASAHNMTRCPAPCR